MPNRGKVHEDETIQTRILSEIKDLTKVFSVKDETLEGPITASATALYQSYIARAAAGVSVTATPVAPVAPLTPAPVSPTAVYDPASHPSAAMVSAILNIPIAALKMDDIARVMQGLPGVNPIVAAPIATPTPVVTETTAAVASPAATPTPVVDTPTPVASPAVTAPTVDIISSATPPADPNVTPMQAAANALGLVRRNDIVIPNKAPDCFGYWPKVSNKDGGFPRACLICPFEPVCKKSSVIS